MAIGVVSWAGYSAFAQPPQAPPASLRIAELEARLYALEAGRERRAELQNALLQPVFLLSGVESVGSAVLVGRQRDGAGSRYFALTNFHVVRDILAEREAAAEPVVDASFERAGGTIHLAALAVAEDPARDLALLRLDTALELGDPARLAPRARSGELQPFASVFTVGCPLGTGVQATHGTISRPHWELDGRRYLMVNSPAYFGNSGGGVFLEETRELVGVFAKIYTYGSFHPQVVTHMGLAVPLEEVHAWLEGAGYAWLLPQEP